MKPFIQDNERILNATTDLLKTGVYAENLERVIENTPQDKVFTIGVFGGWGTGKSSIIRTTQEQIEKKHKDVKFITYDAWKYANDSFRRMFLLQVQQDLKMRQSAEMSRFYQSEMAEVEPQTKFSAKGLAVAVVVVAIVSIVLWLTSIPVELKFAFPTIGTLGTFLWGLLNGLFYDLKISYSKPALFAPEQFESCFKVMMSKCLKRKTWLQKTWNAAVDYVEVGEVSIVGLEKLVIVIDNIDRCPSDTAYQMLTDIKTFLSNENYNLVFVVPVDDEALKKHLFRRWNNANDIDVNKEKEEFLRKFFNVTLRIKPHQETELLHFAHEINKESNLGLSNDTLSVVAKEFADNPRRIIQLLNNLSGYLALYEDEFAKENETAICIALILQEEYTSFYKDATKNLDLVRKFKDEDVKNKYGASSDSLRAFMRVADVILKATSLEVLQKIFTNTSSIFSDLPLDVQKAVTTYDIEKVIEFANTNAEQKENLVDFAIEKLNTEIKYGATSQTTQWIEFFIQLYKADVFDNSRFPVIESSLSQYYKVAIPLIKDQDALNYMGCKMSTAGYVLLRDAVLEFLKGEETSEKGVSSGEVLKSYLKNYTSEQDSSDIASVVENYYTNNPINKDLAYTEVQIKHLFGDTFVGKLIDKFATFNDDARINDIIWCIERNKELTKDTFIKLFDKLIGLFGNTRGKTKEEYVVLIQIVLPIINVIKTSSLTTEPKQIYDTITGTRGIPNPNPNLRTQVRFDTQCSILDEVDAEQAKLLIEFCFGVYRTTGGDIDISASISKLYAKYKDLIVEDSLKINSLGISLKPLASILIKDNDYASSSDLSLIEILLTRQNDGNFLIDVNTVKAKIQELVNNASDGNVEALVGKLVKDEEILGFVAEYVASLESESINNLPVSISKYAVSTFKRENADTYQNNEEFLILVLKQGTSYQKKEVVRLMKDKINNETDLEMVVNVLDDLVTEDQKMLNSLVAELDGIKESETVSEENKKRIAELASKLSNLIRKPSVLGRILKKK